MSNQPKTTKVAASHAHDFGLELQKEGESDEAFRNRISSALRDAGNFIEAHEAFQDALFDQSADVMTGIIGAVAQQYQGVDYGVKGGQQVGADIAAGTIAQTPKRDDSGLLLLALLMGGGDRR